MRKMKFKEVKTVAKFLEINESGTVVNTVIEREGKVKARDFLKELETRAFVNGTLDVEVVTSIYQIPMNVIEELIHASNNSGFVELEIADTTILWLPKPLWIRSEVSELNTLRTIVYDAETIGSRKTEGIVIPTETYEYLLNEYKVIPEDETFDMTEPEEIDLKYDDSEVPFVE